VTIEASHIVLEGILAQDAVEAGVAIKAGANYNVIRDIEVTNVGAGVAISGEHNLITRCNIHDLNMIVNTCPADTNDDYGAIGFLISASNNEVSYSRCTNCQAPSCDYEQDGGFVELYVEDGTIDQVFVHHNVATATNGFLETGGNNATIQNITVAYNLLYEVGGFCFHDGDVFGTSLNNIDIENNTIIATGTSPIIGCLKDPSAVQLRNNIFSGMETLSPAGIAHSYNLYNLAGRASPGYALGLGEVIGDPLFQDPANGDFRLSSGSPAIDMGLELGYQVDLDGNSVPAGPAPDVGVYEYDSAGVGSGGSAGTGGSDSSSGTAGHVAGDAGEAPESTTPASGQDSGCSCRAPRTQPRAGGAWLMLGLFAMVRRRDLLISGPPELISRQEQLPN
jgi:MYXO-CTERM domain-containing protein